MRVFGWIIVIFVTGSAAGSARAVLHASFEKVAELPAQWRGFLIDHRTIRRAAVLETAETGPNPLRAEYLDRDAQWDESARKSPPTAGQSADRGALLIRLGRHERAIEFLRSARRIHPDQYEIAANLAVAFFAAGFRDDAVRAQIEVVRLAPKSMAPLEKLQLKFFELRAAERTAKAPCDDLFGTTFTGEDGGVSPSRIAVEQRRRLPMDDVAWIQQLALSFPSDGRLLLLAGELANAHGDVRTAAAILDGCVTEFGLTDPGTRERRRVYRSAADAIAKLPDREHEKYRGDTTFRSARPIVRRIDPSRLPTIVPDRTNDLPWNVLNDTSIEKPFRPRYHEYLKRLDGTRIRVTGFMQPVGNDLEVGGFMLVEFPVGCWFCEVPDPAGIVYVELGKGKSAVVRRTRVNVVGTLKLNAADPEEFLYTLQNALVTEPD